jgi:DeoR/GlpR family transcriptional regulator of sugar metabolism
MISIEHSAHPVCANLLLSVSSWCIVCAVTTRPHDPNSQPGWAPIGAADASLARALGAHRHDVILAEVRRRGSVRVAELAVQLGVSEMTVRRDLDALDSAGQLVKVHGGAVQRSERMTDEPGFAAKSSLSLSEKYAIAVAAARMVRAGAAIGITAGTTTWQLARFLVDVADLTVVTNSARVAGVLHESPRQDRTVVLTGGVRTPSDALVGPLANTALKTLHLDAVFMGVHGISERAGYSTPNLMEADTNRCFVASAERLVVLADHTKWNVVGLSSIAPLDAAHALVTDDLMPEAAQATLDASIPQVIYAEARGTPASATNSVHVAMREDVDGPTNQLRRA